MSTNAKSRLAPLSTAELVGRWNKHFPVGSKVRYWPERREGNGKVSATISEAELLDHRSAVVWIAGEYGSVPLSHVEPINPVAQFVRVSGEGRAA